MSYRGESLHKCLVCGEVASWPADEFPDQCWADNPKTGQVCGSEKMKRLSVEILDAGMESYWTPPPREDDPHWDFL